jgi:hypothetical protein
MPFNIKLDIVSKQCVISQRSSKGKVISTFNERARSKLLTVFSEAVQRSNKIPTSIRSGEESNLYLPIKSG